MNRRTRAGRPAQTAFRFGGGLVHSNLVIAAAATGVGVTTIGVASLPFEALPLLFVFVASWFAYTANRFTDRSTDRRNLPDRARFIDRYGRGILLFASLGYLGMVALVARLEPWMLPVAVVPPIAIAAYATGLASRHFAIKNGLVGLAWAAIPLGLGRYYGVLTDPAVLVHAATVFVFLAIAAAVFDIKDIEGDRVAGSRTLPVLVGPDRTRRFAMFGVAIMAVPISLASVTVSLRLAVLGVYLAYLLVAIPFADPDRGPLYYGLVIDGEHVLVGGIAWMLWVIG